MSKFKEIIGGTEEEAYAKFPWLKGAEFNNAVVDITGGYLIWKGGMMGDNLSAQFLNVVQINGKLEWKQ